MMTNNGQANNDKATARRKLKKVEIADRRRRVALEILRRHSSRQPGQEVNQVEVARAARVPLGSIGKDLKSMRAAESLIVSPYLTPFCNMHLVEVCLDNGALRDMWNNGEPTRVGGKTLADFAREASQHRTGPHEAVLEMMVAVIETETDLLGRHWSNHLVVSNCLVVQGSDYPLIMLINSDDAYTLGRFVRDTLLVTKPVKDARSHIVGWNRAFDGYCGHRNDEDYEDAEGEDRDG